MKSLLKRLEKTKADGPDEISNLVLGELLFIFQNSMRQGKLPKMFVLEQRHTISSKSKTSFVNQCSMQAVRRDN